MNSQHRCIICCRESTTSLSTIAPVFRLPIIFTRAPSAISCFRRPSRKPFPSVDRKPLTIEAPRGHILNWRLFQLNARRDTGTSGTPRMFVILDPENGNAEAGNLVNDSTMMWLHTYKSVRARKRRKTKHHAWWREVCEVSFGSSLVRGLKRACATFKIVARFWRWALKAESAY